MVHLSAATIGFEGGAANGSERFAYGSQIAERRKAKDDVDNVGAGRAAKGANPIGYTKKAIPSRGGFFDIFSAATIGFEGGDANESERFAYGSQHTDRPKAKDDIDNVGAGRHLDLTKPQIGYTKAKKSY